MAWDLRYPSYLRLKRIGIEPQVALRAEWAVSSPKKSNLEEESEAIFDKENLPCPAGIS